jgi:RNA polymerase sigma factor (sigma-70 family)
MEPVRVIVHGMDAFKAQFRKLCAMLRKQGKRPDEAEDLVQEAFVRLLKYTEEGNKVLEPEAFLARTVFNLATDHARREHAHLYEKRPVEELVLLDSSPGPEDQAAHEQQLRWVDAALKTAGERSRKAYVWHKMGFTYDQIGRKLNISGRTVEQDVAKAIAVLALLKQRRP